MSYDEGTGFGRKTEILFIPHATCAPFDSKTFDFNIVVYRIRQAHQPV